MGICISPQQLNPAFARGRGSGCWWHAGGNFRGTVRMRTSQAVHRLQGIMRIGSAAAMYWRQPVSQCTVESFDPAHSSHLFHAYRSCKNATALRWAVGQRCGGAMARRLVRRRLRDRTLVIQCPVHVR